MNYLVRNEDNVVMANEIVSSDSVWERLALNHVMQQ